MHANMPESLKQILNTIFWLMQSYRNAKNHLSSQHFLGPLYSDLQFALCADTVNYPSSRGIEKN